MILFQIVNGSLSGIVIDNGLGCIGGLFVGLILAVLTYFIGRYDEGRRKKADNIEKNNENEAQLKQLLLEVKNEITNNLSKSKELRDHLTVSESHLDSTWTESNRIAKDFHQDSYKAISTSPLRNKINSELYDDLKNTYTEIIELSNKAQASVELFRNGRAVSSHPKDMALLKDELLRRSTELEKKLSQLEQNVIKN